MRSWLAVFVVRWWRRRRGGKSIQPSEYHASLSEHAEEKCKRNFFFSPRAHKKRNLLPRFVPLAHYTPDLFFIKKVRRRAAALRQKSSASFLAMPSPKPFFLLLLNLLLLDCLLRRLVAWLAVRATRRRRSLPSRFLFSLPPPQKSWLQKKKLSGNEEVGKHKRKTTTENLPSPLRSQKKYLLFLLLFCAICGSQSGRS